MARKSRFERRTHQQVSRASLRGNSLHSRRLRYEPLEDRRLLAYQDIILADDPIGYWRMEEIAGTVATDSSLSGDDATYEASVDLGLASTSPLLGNAAGFDDQKDTENDFVQLSQPLAIGSSSNTVEAWVRVDPGLLQAGERAGSILGNFGAGGSGIANWEIHTDGRLRIYWNTGEVDELGTTDLSDGDWHHVAVVRDTGADEFVAYVDGAVELTTASSGSDIAFTASALHRIGSDHQAGTPIVFNGAIDELAVYDRALTPTEIAEHYQAGAQLAGQGFESPFNLGDLQPGNGGDGSLGFSSALGPLFDLGDLNGDGYDDFALDDNRIVFGRAAGLPTEVGASLINGIDGVAVSGGTSLRAAGDFNGDGFDDIAVTTSGAAYVVYGQPNLPATITPSTMTPAEGVTFATTAGLGGTRDYTGVGDLNGDGYADVAITKNSVSQAYVVFGRGDEPASVDLDTLDGTDGFRVDAETNADFRLVEAAGDVNGDGYDDLLLEAVFGSGGVNDTAKGYVVYGTPNGFTAALASGDLDGDDGFFIANFDFNDLEFAGHNMTAAGDFNGDGYDDLLIGARKKGFSSAGVAYIYYGGPDLAASFNIESLDGANGDGTKGFALKSFDANDFVGFTVDALGDVNGDGLDDVVVGAFGGDPNGGESGESYVVFGTRQTFSSDRTITTIEPTYSEFLTTGLRLQGPAASNQAGFVSAAGDINGDGYNEVFVNRSLTMQRRGWALYGGDFSELVSLKGTLEDESFDAAIPVDPLPVALLPPGDRIVTGAGNDQTVGIGAEDVAYGGQGDDLFEITDMSFTRIAGGNGQDTLRIANQMNLVLWEVPRSQLSGIERIDLTPNPDSFLALKLEDALALSDHSNTLIVDAVAGNEVFIGFGWTVAGTEMIDGVEYTHYTQGAATVKVPSVVEVNREAVFEAAAITGGDGSFGTVIGGDSAGAMAGRSVAGVGDLNNDGFEDFAVGADPTSLTTTAAYVFFGDGDGFNATIGPNLLNGTNGFRIDGGLGGDIGVAIDGAGDVNNDGIDDLILGAPGLSGGAGAALVIFGSEAPFAPVVDPATLNGTNGFRIDGVTDQLAGASVAGRGDLNGDGIKDLLIGAPGELANNVWRGFAYAIYGRATPFAATLSLGSDADVRFLGENIGPSHAGTSVDFVGDLNGDGFDEVAIGSPFEEGVVVDRPVTIVFGGAGLAGDFSLAAVDGNNGFEVVSTSSFELVGSTVSGAGDVNGDGLDDLIVGRPLSDFGSQFFYASSYLIFGAENYPASVTIETDAAAPGRPDSLAGVANVRFSTGALEDKLGHVVAGLGDVNADGYADNAITAYDANGVGEAYVVFGRADGWPTDLDLHCLHGRNGFRIDGIAAGDQLGFAIAGAGDVNGDGFDDILAGAPMAGAEGEAYLIYGGNFSRAVDYLGGAGSDDFTGNIAPEVFVGGQDTDLLRGLGGFDVLIGGEGNDFLTVPSNYFRKVDGGRGFDTLALEIFSVLDLTQLPDPQIDGIEAIRSGGNAVVTLDYKSVLDLSDESNQLVLDLRSSDELNLGAGWTEGATFEIEGKPFTVYTQGIATLFVSVVQSQAIDLHDLIDGSPDGAAFRGNSVFEEAGFTGSSAGDVNGDGYDDLLIGTDTGGSGLTYLVYGGLHTGLNELGDLPGLGFATVFTGSESAGFSLAGAGDYNGDGFDDLLFGSDTGLLASLPGDAYLVYGKAGGFGATFDLNGLSDVGSDGTDGFRLFGVAPGDGAGFLVDAAGDVNGDGFSDLLIAAPFADHPAGRSGAGERYVVYGRPDQPEGFLLNDLNGTNGFTIRGVDQLDQLNGAAAAAGDVNGDGYDDIVIGAHFAYNNAAGVGEAYVVFGQPGPRDPFFELEDLTLYRGGDGSAGFVLRGVEQGDQAGLVVSSAGDINGDGIEDVVVAAPLANDKAGEVYVVFGSAVGFPAEIELDSLDGANGFYINGVKGDLPADFNDILPGTFPGSGAKRDFAAAAVTNGDQAGLSVAPAGDVNGDGFDDLLLGAPFASPQSRYQSGQVYLLFGSNGGFGERFLLDDIDGANGLVFNGADGIQLSNPSGDEAGTVVRTAGDVNGDGFDDVFIGAPDATLTAKGEAFVFYGREAFPTTPGFVGDELNNTLPGTVIGEALIGGDGDDTLVSLGADSSRGGRGNDVIQLQSLDFRRVNGGAGTDVLQLVVADAVLDLTATPDTRIEDIEAIELRGNGAQSVVLDGRETAAISSHSNTLIVLRDTADSVDIGAGWTDAGAVAQDGLNFQMYFQAAATLLVQIPDALPGDYNQDGSVDSADYTVWRDTLGQTVTPGDGADGDGSGTIDRIDFLFWKTNYGATTQQPAASVPAMVIALAVKVSEVSQPETTLAVPPSGQEGVIAQAFADLDDETSASSFRYDLPDLSPAHHAYDRYANEAVLLQHIKLLEGQHHTSTESMDGGAASAEHDDSTDEIGRAEAIADALDEWLQTIKPLL